MPKSPPTMLVLIKRGEHQAIQTHLISQAIALTPTKIGTIPKKIEDRYGDLVSWLYGLGVVGADGIPHLEKKQTPRKKQPKKSNNWLANPYLEGNPEKQAEYIKFMRNQNKAYK